MVIHPYSKESIPVEKKISFDRYIRICWENSRTNLHYLDFKRLYEGAMKRMFNIYKEVGEKP